MPPDQPVTPPPPDANTKPPTGPVYDPAKIYPTPVKQLGMNGLVTAGPPDRLASELPTTAKKQGIPLGVAIIGVLALPASALSLFSGLIFGSAGSINYIYRLIQIDNIVYVLAVIGLLTLSNFSRKLVIGLAIAVIVLQGILVHRELDIQRQISKYDTGASTYQSGDSSLNSTINDFNIESAFTIFIQLVAIVYLLRPSVAADFK